MPIFRIKDLLISGRRNKQSNPRFMSTKGKRGQLITILTTDDMRLSKIRRGLCLVTLGNALESSEVPSITINYSMKCPLIAFSTGSKTS